MILEYNSSGSGGSIVWCGNSGFAMVEPYVSMGMCTVYTRQGTEQVGICD